MTQGMLHMENNTKVSTCQSFSLRKFKFLNHSVRLGLGSILKQLKKCPCTKYLQKMKGMVMTDMVVLYEEIGESITISDCHLQTCALREPWSLHPLNCLLNTPSFSSLNFHVSNAMSPHVFILHFFLRSGLKVEVK